MPLADVLFSSVLAQIGGASAEWLRGAREQAAGSMPQLLRVYTQASRHLGRAAFVLHPPDATVPAELAVVASGRWTLEDAGRLALLLARQGAPSRGARHGAASRVSDDFAAAAIDCYEQGDAREQESWLRGVALLPEPQRFLPTVIDACRTSVLPLFEAVACENPYPSQYFPDRNFNQLVLKALFNGVPLSRIVGLRSRTNPELSRMARDYADERRAAGRSVPADIDLAVADAGT